MYDHAVHVSRAFGSVSSGSYGTVRDDLVYVVAIFAWAKALSAIGAAYMKRMIPLRTLAMLGNVFGVLTGLFSGNLATLFEHLVNFPLNATRMREMRRLMESVHEANTAELNIEWLKPFMHPRALKAGQRVFSKGDEANEAFVLIEGRIAIPDKSVVLDPGTIFGEMALFTPDCRRTATALCSSDVRLLVITYEQFEQLYFQNPEFGLYLIRLIVRRYEMNQAVPGAPNVFAIDAK